jgi:hypothetical protein
VLVHRTVLGVQARNEVCCGSRATKLTVSTLSPLSPQQQTLDRTSKSAAVGHNRKSMRRVFNDREAFAWHAKVHRSRNDRRQSGYKEAIREMVETVTVRSGSVPGRDRASTAPDAATATAHPPHDRPAATAPE